MNRNEWYNAVNEKIKNNTEIFYSTFYRESDVFQTGGVSHRINPCPICGHNDCATINTIGGYVNCFSEGCTFKGNHVTAFLKYAEIAYAKEKNPKSYAIKLLSSWAKIPFPRYNSEKDKAIARKAAITQEIREIAVDFYHKQLKTCDVRFNVADDENERLISLTPLEYQKEIRKHSLISLESFKVGFTSESAELKKIFIEKGFSDEDVGIALKYIPEGVFLYPYINPITGDIERLNIKNPFEQTREIKGKEIEFKGFSVGKKVCGFSPLFNFKGDIIIVEGENDAISVFEEGFVNVVFLGGTINEDCKMLEILEKCSGKIYVATDNDSAGDNYYTTIDAFFPHKDVRRIPIPLSFNDIDEYYKSDVENKISLSDLISEAQYVYTENYKILTSDIRNWSISNRHKAIEFNIDRLNSKGQISGKIDFYMIDNEGQKFLKDRQCDTTLIKAKQAMKPFAFYLADRIEEYFNSHFAEKTFEELVDIYFYSNYQQSIEREMANRLYQVEGDRKDELIALIKKKLNSDVFDMVCKEMVTISNANAQAALDLSNVPNMKISQYFNTSRNDAYFYFSQDKCDGDAIRRIPFLINNDGHLVRLDVLKRKDNQCLLLVDDKYEIAQEVPSAIIDSRESSLLSTWALKYKDGELSDSEINPYRLIKEIENFIRRFYYFTDNSIYKVLALYIYATYYYELFNQMPYLFLNGEKGSGKSTLDKVLYLLCFNAKLSVDISDASLFRMCAFEGGTLILDEIEKFTSRSKTTDSTMASILKAGYSRSGKVYRYNTDKNANEGFDIYTPKIISNIFGLDDVIGDRCIEIRTYRYDMNNLDINLEDPKYYEAERLSEIRELTSKCCLSALKYFQLMHKVYTDKRTRISTVSPRTAQVVKPLLAVAKFVDIFGLDGDLDNPDLNLVGEYESALSDYHETSIIKSKENMNLTSPEDILKRVIKNIAEEIAIKDYPHEDKVYTIVDNYKYTEPIKYSLEEGWFRVNIVHLKCFLEQEMPGDKIYARNISKWISNIFRIDDKNGDIISSRRVVKLVDSDLIKEWNGARPKVNHYDFRFDSLISLDGSEDVEFEEDNKLF